MMYDGDRVCIFFHISYVHLFPSQYILNQYPSPTLVVEDLEQVC
jgi:hypothetical protein